MKHAMKHAHHHHHNDIRKKWMNMTPEQRQRFIDKRRQFGFGGHFEREYFDMDVHEDTGKEND